MFEREERRWSYDIQELVLKFCTDRKSRDNLAQVAPGFHDLIVSKRTGFVWLIDDDNDLHDLPKFSEYVEEFTLDFNGHGEVPIDLRYFQRLKKLNFIDSRISSTKKLSFSLPDGLEHIVLLTNKENPPENFDENFCRLIKCLKIYCSLGLFLTCCQKTGGRALIGLSNLEEIVFFQAPLYGHIQSIAQLRLSSLKRICFSYADKVVTVNPMDRHYMNVQKNAHNNEHLFNTDTMFDFQRTSYENVTVADEYVSDVWFENKMNAKTLRVVCEHDELSTSSTEQRRLHLLSLFEDADHLYLEGYVLDFIRLLEDPNLQSLFRTVKMLRVAIKDYDNSISLVINNYFRFDNTREFVFFVRSGWENKGRSIDLKWVLERHMCKMRIIEMERNQEQRISSAIFWNNVFRLLLKENDAVKCHFGDNNGVLHLNKKDDSIWYYKYHSILTVYPESYNYKRSVFYIM